MGLPRPPALTRGTAGVSGHVGAGSFAVVWITESAAELVDSHSFLHLLDDTPPLDASWVMGMKCSGHSVAFPGKGSSSLGEGAVVIVLLIYFVSFVS